ncbi:MAG TPA: DUF1343 domain-containing protein [Puia sp.]|nr:DUF1343 domain-containing protein [Puia sp.]
MKISLLIYGLLFLANVTQSQKAPAKQTSAQSITIIPGAERMEIYLPLLKGKSVAVFANQSSLVGKTHLVDTLLKKGVSIKVIFGPEHGFRGTEDAGKDVNASKDSRTGIQIVSLYGDKLKPDANDLRDVDVMLFDIQDVGVRFYTYISSLQKYIEAAVENNRPLIILDRPDPNGFYVDGPVLNPAFKSFVGMQPVPVVYGMTIGEYAKMLVGEKWLDASITGDLNTIHAINDAEKKIDSLINKMTREYADFSMSDFQLIIIPCKNYTHKSRYKLPVKPSPNLPNMQSVYLYPSICFFEGTRISMGRGTDKPFQQFGHPSFPNTLYHFMPRSVPGAKNPPLLNQTCYGFDLSKINVDKEGNNRLQLKWLIKAYSLFPSKDDFFLSSGYFNKLAGNDMLMQQIKEGISEQEIRKSWEPALGNFKKIRKKYLLYTDF